MISCNVERGRGVQVNEMSQLIEAISKSEIRQFIYKTNNECLSISKAVMVEQFDQMTTDTSLAYLEAAPTLGVHNNIVQDGSKITPQNTELNATIHTKQNDKSIDIPAPFVGTVMFNDSKTGGNFVKLGDKVEKDQLLFVMESMKLFTDVVSPVSGTISQICVENNQIVEFGTVIMKIEES